MQMRAVTKEGAIQDFFGFQSEITGECGKSSRGIPRPRRCTSCKRLKNRKQEQDAGKENVATHSNNSRKICFHKAQQSRNEASLSHARRSHGPTCRRKRQYPMTEPEHSATISAGSTTQARPIPPNVSSTRNTDKGSQMNIPESPSSKSEIKIQDEGESPPNKTEFFWGKNYERTYPKDITHGPTSTDHTEEKHRYN